MSKLSVGDKMPNFTFDTATRSGVTVQSVLGTKKKTIFWVLRYIGCTTCRYDVHVLSQMYDQFLAKDAQIFVVMQSVPEQVRADLEGYPMPFEIICDPEMAIYKALEINPAASKEERQPTTEAEIAKMAAKREKVKESGFVHGKYEGDEQQLPAFFILGQDGVALYAHYAKNSIDMPTPEEALALL